MKQVVLTDYQYESVKEKIRQQLRKTNPTTKDIQTYIGNLCTK